MTKCKCRPSHPGEILQRHYLLPGGITQKNFSDVIEVSEKHLSQLINGRRRLDPDIAVRIAKTLGTTTELWLNLQKAVDLWDAEQACKDWKPKVVFVASFYAYEISDELAKAIANSKYGE